VTPDYLNIHKLFMEISTQKPVHLRFIVPALLSIFLVTSCARKINFTNSAVVPAAEGYVKVKKDNNNNYALDIRVKNLASPKKLTPPKETYVVWIETGSGTKNIGQLSSASGFFTGSLKASLKTVSPYKPTRLWITAENDGSLQYPGAQSVLVTDGFSVR
jgi:hypothetical protein